MNRIITVLLAACLAAACTEKPAVTSAPSPTPPVYDPRPQPEPALPFPPPGDPNVGLGGNGGNGGGGGGASAAPVPTAPTVLTLYATVLTRHAFPFTIEELGALGWYAIDTAAGTASWYHAGVGREDVRWSVPPARIVRGGTRIWMNGTSTSVHNSSLNLQPGIWTYGFKADPWQIGTQAVSADGVPEEAPEVSTTISLRDNAVIGEEARVDVGLGWQAEGVFISYRYRYDP